MRGAWQDHGYFEVQVRGDAKVLSSRPASERMSVRIHLDEDQQYRWQGIRFHNNREIRNVDALRSLFPLKDGDGFDRAAISKGLDNLRVAYRELGIYQLYTYP